ncbi:MAG: hypothetical protein HY399_00420 [Elusimicrobia bacterium]|nr:hypothetical protein [Elusimicrobiota bacterium]
MVLVPDWNEKKGVPTEFEGAVLDSLGRTESEREPISPQVSLDMAWFLAAKQMGEGGPEASGPQIPSRKPGIIKRPLIAGEAARVPVGEVTHLWGRKVAPPLNRKDLSQIPGFELLQIGVNQRPLSYWKIPENRQPIIDLTRKVTGEVLQDDQLLLEFTQASFDLPRYEGRTLGDAGMSREEQRQQRLKESLRRRRLADVVVQLYGRRGKDNLSVLDKEDLIRELSIAGPAQMAIYFDMPISPLYASSVVDFLEEQGLSFIRDRFLMETTSRVQWLYQKFFPQFYREFPLVVQYLQTQDKNAGHARDHHGLHQIIFMGDKFDIEANEERRQKTVFTQSRRLDPRSLTKQKTQALITLFHEYAHGIFDEVIVPEEQETSVAGKPTAYHVMTEGFAVMMEMLMMDKAIEERFFLGLTDQDVEDLGTWRKQRYEYLRKAKNHYTHGTLYFWHRLYKQEGEGGMLRFLQGLDVEKLRSMSWMDLEYWLIQNTPELFRATLTRTGDPDLKKGIEHLTAYAQGKKVPEEARAQISQVLERVSPLALRRLIHGNFELAGLCPNCMNVHAVPRDVSRLAATFRLAGINAALAKDLAEYMLRIVSRRDSRIRFAETLYLGSSPEWVRLLLQEATQLLTDSQDKERWFKGIFQLALLGIATSQILPSPKVVELRNIVLGYLAKSWGIHPGEVLQKIKSDPNFSPDDFHKDAQDLSKNLQRRMRMPMSVLRVPGDPESSSDQTSVR